MASSRDDFIIAIRSAFLKKSTKQKFSLLTLVFLSIFIIILSNFNFKIIQHLRIVVNEIVYRSSLLASLPENLLNNGYLEIKKYSSFYSEFKANKDELERLKSNNIITEIIISENKELKNLIEDYTLTTNKILAKVIVDHNSPFLKTIIINKGSGDGIKIGTNIYDKNYLIGRIIEVNFKSSRVLLLSDLNSSVPISIIPGNIQAIVMGNGINSGEIKYIKDNLIDDIDNKSIAYTSGAGSIFKSGIPVGRLNLDNNNLLVNFYSDFTQLKYVFAEIEQEKIKSKADASDTLEKNNTEKIKLNILNDEIGILKQSNSKFIEENQILQNQNNQLNLKINSLQNKIDSQKNEIAQYNIDQEELKFLKLNLIFSSKCQKTVFNKGYTVGTKDYKDCILRRGAKLDD